MFTGTSVTEVPLFPTAALDDTKICALLGTSDSEKARRSVHFKKNTATKRTVSILVIYRSSRTYSRRKSYKGAPLLLRHGRRIWGRLTTQPRVGCGRAAVGEDRSQAATDVYLERRNPGDECTVAYLTDTLAFHKANHDLAYISEICRVRRVRVTVRWT